jgi:hypothetical protein
MLMACDVMGCAPSPTHVGEEDKPLKPTTSSTVDDDQSGSSIEMSAPSSEESSEEVASSEPPEESARAEVDAGAAPESMPVSDDDTDATELEEQSDPAETTEHLSPPTDADAGDEETETSPPEGKPTFIASGTDMVRRYSLDGLQWNDTVPGAQVTGDDNLGTALAIGNGVAVVGGHHGVMRSTDGINWSEQAGPNLNGGCAAFFNDQFVMLASEFTYTSSDGESWEQHSQPDAEWADWGQHWNATAVGAGHLVAVGDRNCQDNEGVIKVTEDGTTWHDFTEAHYGWGAVVYGNGMFVASGKACDGGGPALATSVDGTTWDVVANDSEQIASSADGSLMFVDDKFVTCTPSRCFGSSDAQEWTDIGAAPNGYKVVAFLNGVYLATNWESHLSASKDLVEWVNDSNGNYIRFAFGYVRD